MRRQTLLIATTVFASTWQVSWLVRVRGYRVGLLVVVRRHLDRLDVDIGGGDRWCGRELAVCVGRPAVAQLVVVVVNCCRLVLLAVRQRVGGFWRAARKRRATMRIVSAALVVIAVAVSVAVIVIVADVRVPDKICVPIFVVFKDARSLNLAAGRHALRNRVKSVRVA